MLMDVHILPVQAMVGLKVSKCSISPEGVASHLLCLHPSLQTGESEKT